VGFSIVLEQGIHMRRLCWALALLSSFVLHVGCDFGPSRVAPVSIDASSASRQALELYDKNGDGAIDGAELDAVPGIKKNLSHYDSNSDGRVTADEIAARLNDWAAQKLALMGCSYIVTLDGQPLEEATITMVPEQYLGPNVKPATGITAPNGLARMSHADEDLPKTANGRPMAGVKSGTYKVQITHPSRKIPAKYNSATELGEEVAYDLNPNGVPIQVSLKSN
jgi:hypothetical protein